jgi:hypothetical protein
MAPKPYYRRWLVYLRGEQIGMVIAATEKAARLRPSGDTRSAGRISRKLQVRPLRDDSPLVG